MADRTKEASVVIIGAGPAGLTAAYTLSKHDVPTVVLEADEMVGGIARTINYKGYLFDIGGHRFFTKWDEINETWQEILGSRFVERPRLSRIYYRKKFFYYPLRPRNALLGLGLLESFRVLASYLWAQLFFERNETNFEQWVSNRFGQRLYEIFFKTYTEKVWGIPCNQISAEWAAQRIRGLSLATAIRNALLKQHKNKAKTLVDRFHYPERGPGQMWETLTDHLRERGYPVLRQRPVVRICHAGGKVSHLVTGGPHGEGAFYGTHFISSMPIRDLINALQPAPPPEVIEAANRLHYRDFLIVSLILDRENVMPDNWIYIHEPDVKVGRIQNFKNWSAAMVPDPKNTCLGMEYFVFEDNELWRMADSELISMAKKELVQLGLARAEEIKDGAVVRVPKAYPMYDNGWSEQLKTVRDYLEANLANLQLVGRNGMHKYNNQDHSMMTAICAARNILGAHNDLWAINTEPDYQEERQERPAGESSRPAYAEPIRIEQASQNLSSENAASRVATAGEVAN